jgi:dUTP pyrophosphatase
MNLITVPMILKAEHADLQYPAYATAGASGVDLCAAVWQFVTVSFGQIVVIPTGVSLAIPDGYEGQVRPRSGLAAKHGVAMVNAPGTIDADYRGEISVILTVLKREPFTIERGMRIAQLVFAPIVKARLEPADHLPPTARGAAGFGSTGSR